MPIHQQVRTVPGEGVEADVWAEFDAVLGKHEKWFKVAKEVTGWFIACRTHCPVQRPRIDRILLPSVELRNAGWVLGPVGVELKRPGAKIGPAISQALDYSRAVFPISAGLTVNLEWIFIWPVDRVTGDLESVMAQNRIGCARSWNGVDLEMSGGDGGILRCSPGNITTLRKPGCGYKVGSR